MLNTVVAFLPGNRHRLRNRDWVDGRAILAILPCLLASSYQKDAEKLVTVMVERMALSSVKTALKV